MAAGAPGMSNLTSFTSVFQLPASRLIGPVAGPAVAPASAVAVPSALPASSDLPQPASARATPSAATVANLFINFHPPVVGQAETPIGADGCKPIAAARGRSPIGPRWPSRSEEHTSELHSLLRNSHAV